MASLTQFCFYGRAENGLSQAYKAVFLPKRETDLQGKTKYSDIHLELGSKSVVGVPI